MLGRLQRWPCLRLLPTCDMGSALCVMGGRQRFLGHACSSYMCTGSALEIMDYGLARAGDSATHGRMVYIKHKYIFAPTDRRATYAIFFSEVHISLHHVLPVLHVCIAGSSSR